METESHASKPLLGGLTAAAEDDNDQNADRKPYSIRLSRIIVHDQWVEPGMTVQLRRGTVTSRGNVLQCSTYLRVEKIGVRNFSSTSSVQKRVEVVFGRLYRRTRDLYGILPRKHGEVAWISDNAEVGVASILRIRKLRMTNGIFPSYRVSQADAHDDTGGTLICRWKIRIKDAPEGGSGIQQLGDCGFIRRLTRPEADEGYGVEDDLIYSEWRGLSPSGTESPASLGTLGSGETGNGNPASTSNIHHTRVGFDVVDLTKMVGLENSRDLLEGFGPVVTKNGVVDLTERPHVSGVVTSGPRIRATGECRYTFGDAFCGAGGVTCGAVAAGLRLVFGVDKDENAITAWKSNFGNDRGFRCEIHDFVTNQRIGSKRHVDVLHMSPPCQTFSWAKTTQGKDDEINEASLFAVEALLDFCRPRAATVEQTDGLISIGKHQEHFYSLLLQFTSRNFSVKWGVLQALDYGVPQKRKRLVIISSCPGETVADLPRPTHYHQWANVPNRNKLPLVPTLRQTLLGIPIFAEDQQVHYLQRPPDRPLHDWDGPLPRTIKAGGGDYDVHPDGGRRFTVREIACLTTFPMTHRFYGADCTKHRQVGNAVPVKMAEAVFKKIIEHLNEQDDARAGFGIL